MRARLLLSTLAGLALLGPSPPPRAARRIVSLGLCADQLLVALADRGQIAGLTEWARDPRLSSVTRQARALPFTHRSAEEVLALRPDLVIDAPFRVRGALAPLLARGTGTVDLPPGDSVPAIERGIAALATAIGHPDRGAAMIARMRRDLAALGPPPGRGRVAAYYQRQGYLTGTGTLIDDMLRRVGLVNLATRLGRPALSILSLEELVLARPDFLVMDAGAAGAGDRGGAVLRHPLLDAATAPSRHLFVPQALTLCGGPAYPRAVAMLAAQVRKSDTPTRIDPHRASR